MVFSGCPGIRRQLKLDNRASPQIKVIIQSPRQGGDQIRFSVPGPPGILPGEEVISPLSPRSLDNRLKVKILVEVGPPNVINFPRATGNSDLLGDVQDEALINLQVQVDEEINYHNMWCAGVRVERLDFNIYSANSGEQMP